MLTPLHRQAWAKEHGSLRKKDTARTVRELLSVLRPTMDNRTACESGYVRLELQAAQTPMWVAETSANWLASAVHSKKGTWKQNIETAKL